MLEMDRETIEQKHLYIRNIEMDVQMAAELIFLQEQREVSITYWTDQNLNVHRQELFSLL